MDLGVVESEDVRLGSLICWEHWMPLSRAYLHQQHEHVHGALWPTVNEHHQLASRHYAFEGRCYVAAVGSVMTKQQMLEGIASHGSIDPEIDAMLAPLDDGLLMRGGSALIAPDASYIVEPVWDEPGIIYGEADLAALPEYYQSLDTGGHYSRPELFDFKPRA
jgi:predicted amidohydrolase